MPDQSPDMSWFDRDLEEQPDRHAPLYEVKQWVRDRITAKNPTAFICPCCMRSAQVYRRNIHHEMVRWLAALVRLWSKDEQPHRSREIYPGSQKASSDGPYLRFWGIVDRVSFHEWVPTHYGLDWLYGARPAWKHLWLFQDRVVAHSEETVDVHEAITTHFDWADLHLPPNFGALPIPRPQRT